MLNLNFSSSPIPALTAEGFATLSYEGRDFWRAFLDTDEIRELENLTKKIAHVIQQAIGLAVKVKLVEPHSLERSMGKAVHVIDKRKLV